MKNQKKTKRNSAKRLQRRAAKNPPETAAPDANDPKVFEDITSVCRALSKRFHIPGYTRAELSQQGWIYALQALPKYDAAKSALRTFLYMCVRDGFKMLRRSLLGRTRICQCAAEPIEPCDACRKHRAASETRISLISPADISDSEIGDDIKQRLISKDNPAETAEFREITEAIDSGLPASLRGAYLRMVDGAPTSSYDRRLVRTAVAKILEEKGSDNGAR